MAKQETNKLFVEYLQNKGHYDDETFPIDGTLQEKHLTAKLL